jgi:hypothetical protein
MATITDYALAKFGSVSSGVICAAFNSCPGMFTMTETHRLLETSADVHKGVLPRVINLRKGPYTKSRLSYAVGYVKKAARVRKLLEFGADVTAVDWKGATILHDAIIGSSVDVVKVILAHSPELLAKADK